MKRSRKNGKKTMILVVIICIVLAAGIGIGVFISGRMAQNREDAGSKNSAQSDGVNIKDGLAEKDDSDTDNSDAGNSKDKTDSGKDNSMDTAQKGGTGNQDNKQDSSAVSGQGSSTYDASIPEDDMAVHTYEYILSDCTWQEAFQDCLNRGGYLVRINSAGEYESIRKEISAQKLTDIYFKIGGRRDSQSRDYYWVNEDNKLFGQKLNADDSWCSDEWMDGEPSFQDGNLEEKYMDVFFFNGEKRFVWNDIPDDMLSAEPDYAGKLGYICEYE